jgi:hypothetical protein
MRTGMASAQCCHPCLEGAERQFDDLLGMWLHLVETQKSGEWSERKELVLGRSLDPAAVAHNQA